MAGKENCRGKEDHGDGCAACLRDDVFPYWCSACNRSVAEKRCPYCGLKAQKKKESGPPRDNRR